MTPDQVGIEITNLIMPFISALLILVITLWLKDFATKIAKLTKNQQELPKFLTNILLNF